jgi:hypothetical protein
MIPFGFTLLGLVASKRLWARVHKLLNALIQKVGIMVIQEPQPNAFSANMPLGSKHGQLYGKMLQYTKTILFGSNA